MVGVLVLMAVLFMPRGIVNLAMKKKWLPAGRSMFRQLARERSAPEPVVQVRATDEIKRAEA